MEGTEVHSQVSKDQEQRSGTDPLTKRLLDLAVGVLLLVIGLLGLAAITAGAFLPEAGARFFLWLSSESVRVPAGIIAFLLAAMGFLLARSATSHVRNVFRLETTTAESDAIRAFVGRSRHSFLYRMGRK